MTPGMAFDAALQVPEKAREKVLTLLTGISQAQSERRPAPEEWSIGEIAHHLVLTERRVVVQIVDLIGAGQEEALDHAQVVARRPFPLEAWADVARSGKAKAPAELIPAAGLKIAGLMADLRAVREETRRTLMPYRQQDLGRLWYHHPRRGPLTLYERIAALGYHELKHLAQMERTLARTG